MLSLGLRSQDRRKVPFFSPQQHQERDLCGRYFAPAKSCRPWQSRQAPLLPSFATARPLLFLPCQKGETYASLQQFIWKSVYHHTISLTTSITCSNCQENHLKHGLWRDAANASSPDTTWLASFEHFLPSVFGLPKH